ncbi:hypothetical protein C0992_004325 [Termitomyces sp. T32_za158]|nr:hypothetical protein C0992_004325 [Termitomyces sp. T32_za158]
MATPSSSATSPSPPMAFIPHPSAQVQSPPSAFMDSIDKEQRQRAVQKFMARAEISTITRALRTRLSYASYKATNNVHHVPLRDLEAHSQNQSQPTSVSRTITAKRRSAGNNYYNNPATQSPLGASPGANLPRRGGSGSMLPPSTTSSPRTYSSAVNGTAYATTSNNDSSFTSKSSLYTSILAPPPTKQARTIHNAGDPPVPASSRPLASPKTRAPKRSPGDINRSQAKSRKLDHGSSPRSPKTRKANRTSTGKGKSRGGGTELDPDTGGDVDMKAAATLTSLLMNHRPSMTGSASSPRSSVDGSEAGSIYSHSHFAQSSTRTIAAASPPAPLSAAASTSTVTEASRIQTPPPPTFAPGLEKTTTPHPAPTDNEAANLMLFLATSPSPARPTNKDTRDLAAFRVLGGGPPGALRDKGRVLFASSPGVELTDAVKPPALGRGGDTRFTSSVSSIGGEMGGVGGGNIQEPTCPVPSQLLPPPSFPSQKSMTNSPYKDVRNDSPRLQSQGPPEFNINDFIHGSPSSPSRVPASKPSLGLRADVGRKLFEEEQMRHALSGVQSPGKRTDRVLGASIDLVQS